MTVCLALSIAGTDQGQARASHFRQYHKRMKPIVNRSRPSLATMIGRARERNCCTPLRIGGCTREQGRWAARLRTGNRLGGEWRVLHSAAEKDLSAREQVELARAVVRAVGQVSGKTIASRVLVNGRVDVALSAEADGVHLPSGPDALSAEEVRRIFAAAGRSRPPVISVACHTLEEVIAARRQSPDCILFAPVFEKVVREGIAVDAGDSEAGASRLPGTGLALLEDVCARQHQSGCSRSEE